jgi:hypothetical protein
VLVERHDRLTPGAVAVDEERLSAALELDPRLQLLRGGDVRR